MHRTHEFKLYLTREQERTLESWLRRCCWVHNKALEHRKKAYKRRGESISFNTQTAMLTQWRSRIPHIRDVPFEFLKDPLRRVDRGMKAFFRRCKTGGKPGFPRFKSSHRFNSMESLKSMAYVRGNRAYIPKLGLVIARGPVGLPSQQRSLRIIRRASGWYAQVLVETAETNETLMTGESVGVDVGLTSFAALSTGETIGNPRWARRSQRQLAHAQRRISRRKKGSKNRRKAVKRLQRVHERIAAQRKDFCHKLSRRLVNENDLIAVENLNVKGLSRTRLARSVMDAGWGIMLQQLAYKAAEAGKQVVEVDPNYTSQECPECRHIKKKTLAERIHHCEACDYRVDRDVAAARVILQRALGVAGASECGGNVSRNGHHDLVQSQ